MEKAPGRSERPEGAGQNLRRAGQMEQWFNYRSRMDLNGWVIVTAKYVNATGHPLSKDVLFAALEQMVSKHPALTARLPPPTSPPIWTALPSVDLNKVVLVLDKDMLDMPTILEGIFARPFNFPEDIPLWQLLVLRDGGVVFTYDHTLGDGQSGLAFHHALLDALNTSPDPEIERSGIVSTLSHAATFPPAIEDLIDISPPLRLLLREFPKAFFPFFVPKKTAEWTGHPIVKELTLETRVRVFHYNPPEASALLKQARAHKTTMTGVLHTLGLVILSHLLHTHSEANAKVKAQNKFKTIATNIPISLRKAAGTPPTTICNHISFRESSHRIPSPSLFPVTLESFPWETAAALSATLRRKAPRSRENLGLLKYLNGKYDAYFLSLLGRKRACGFEVSNLGAFPFRVVFPSPPAPAAKTEHNNKKQEADAAEEETGKKGKPEGEWRIEETVFAQADATLGAAVKVNVCGTGAGGLGVMEGYDHWYYFTRVRYVLRMTR